jgi:aconitate hydratase
MTHAFAHTKQSLPNGGSFFSLPALAAEMPNVARMPVSLRIVLESVLRNCDGKKVTPEHVRALAAWKPNERRTEEIPFVVARVILQDFTGVPLLADLAAMRSVAADMQKDPKSIEPLVPVDLVVDHSVMIDYFGTKQALDLNMKLEFQRNQERYQFMKWGMQAFDTFGVVPPGFGIVHQVNLEYLARGIHRGADKRGDAANVHYPDSLVGTDSHTTMINGIGVVGWGVGGIEAEAAMLGQPVYFLTPDVVGFEFTGKLREGLTATDLVLTVTEILRQAKVVGKFVEFFGEGVASLSVPDRATMANMAPEYGATMGFFPVDREDDRYFRGTGRTAPRSSASAYFGPGLFGSPSPAIDYRASSALDLGTVRRASSGREAAAGPDRARQVKEQFTSLFSEAAARTASTSRRAPAHPDLARAKDVREEAPEAGAAQPVGEAGRRASSRDGRQQADPRPRGGPAGAAGLGDSPSATATC